MTLKDLEYYKVKCTGCTRYVFYYNVLSQTKMFTWFNCINFETNAPHDPKKIDHYRVKKVLSRRPKLQISFTLRSIISSWRPSERLNDLEHYKVKCAWCTRYACYYTVLSQSQILPTLPLQLAVFKLRQFWDNCTKWPQNELEGSKVPMYMYTLQRSTNIWFQAYSIIKLIKFFSCILDWSQVDLVKQSQFIYYWHDWHIVTSLLQVVSIIRSVIQCQLCTRKSPWSHKRNGQR